MLADTKQRSELERALTSPRLEEGWELALDAWETASPLQRSAVRGFAESLRAFILSLARDVAEDSYEAGRTLTMVLLHLQSQWSLFNTQIGYRMMAGDSRGGEEAACRAALVYSLIEAVEGLMPPGEADRIAMVVNDPEAATAAAADPSVYAQLEKPEARVDDYETARGLLESELGTADAAEVVGRVRALEGEAADAHAEAERLQATVADMEARVSALDSPEARQRVEKMERRLVAGEARLAEAEQDRQTLERAIGAHQADAVAARWRELHRQFTEAEQRLAEAETERRRLERELGTADAAAITSRLREQADALAASEAEAAPLRVWARALERELGDSDPGRLAALVADLRQSMHRAETELATARVHREALSRELGTADAPEIVSRFRAMSEKVDTFSGLADVLANLESDLRDLD